MEFQAQFDGLRAQLIEAGRRGYDLAPLLKSVGKEWRDEAREKIRSGDGMPPLAPATIAKREHTGTSLITKHGEIRSGRGKRLDAESKRIRGLLTHYEKRWFGAGTHFVPRDVLDKTARMKTRLENINKLLRRAQESAYSERKTGRSVGDRKGGTRLGQRFISSMFLAVERKGLAWLLLVASRIPWAGAQNDGATVGHGATLPPSHFLVLTADKLAYLSRRLTAFLTEPLR